MSDLFSDVKKGVSAAHFLAMLSGDIE